MSNVLITPLMGLSNPIPSVDPGPDYATNLYNSLNILDNHNHSVGSGNQINPAGIVINADLPFESFNATLLRSVRFSPQTTPLSAATDLGCLYESGVDLYYNDGNGNQVRMTSGGTVNATSSGIASGTATASFSGGVLIVDSNTNTPANIQCGSVLIGDNVASSNFVTLSAPASLAANYTLTLPTALPSSNGLNLTSTAGTQSFATGTAAQTMRGGSTPAFASPNYQVSSSSGSFSSTSGSAVNVTNLSVTITTVGRPVSVFLQPDGSANGFIGASISSATSTAAIFYILRSSSVVSQTELEVGGVSGNLSVSAAPGQVLYLDLPSAGTYTYTVQAAAGTGSTVFVGHCVLVAYEI